MLTKNKKPSLKEVLRGLEKQFGAGCIMRLGDAVKVDVPAIPSGSISLDHALGTGGYPRGRLVEIYGPESSGKTTLALTAIAQAQAQGGTCAFVDAEHALDVVYAQAIGVNAQDLLVSQPDYGEQALAITDRLCQSEAVDLIVVDSVAALVPKAELDGEVGDLHVGTQARLMSQAMRKIAAVASKTHTTVIFINQLRHKIGVKFGSPETTPGGNALKFYASVRLDIRRIASVKQGEANVGNKVRVKVVKNKLAPPFRSAEFEVRFGRGVDRLGEVLEHGTARGLIDRAGAWYRLGDQKIGQGRDNAIAYLAEHPEQTAALEAQVREALAAERIAALAGPGAAGNTSNASSAAAGSPARAPSGPGEGAAGNARERAAAGGRAAA